MEEVNLNGLFFNIVVIVNENGNVFGMMFYLERVSDCFLGSEDGLKLFRSMVMFLE